jgi:hypothetical protein
MTPTFLLRVEARVREARAWVLQDMHDAATTQGAILAVAIIVLLWGCGRFLF